MLFRSNDDCGEYYVKQESLKELVSLCDQVIADPSKAAELLPTVGGFFFGNEEYNDWYLEGINYTSRRLKELLSQASDDSSVYFKYASSW